MRSLSVSRHETPRDSHPFEAKKDRGIKYCGHLMLWSIHPRMILLMKVIGAAAHLAPIPWAVRNRKRSISFQLLRWTMRVTPRSIRLCITNAVGPFGWWQRWTSVVSAKRKAAMAITEVQSKNVCQKRNDEVRIASFPRIESGRLGIRERTGMLPVRKHQNGDASNERPHYFEDIRRSTRKTTSRKSWISNT